MTNPSGCKTMAPFLLTGLMHGGWNLRTYKKSFNQFCSSLNSQSQSRYHPLSLQGQHVKAESSFLELFEYSCQRFQSQWESLNGKVSNLRLSDRFIWTERISNMIGQPFAFIAIVDIFIQNKHSHIVLQWLLLRHSYHLVEILLLPLLLQQPTGPIPLQKRNP